MVFRFIDENKILTRVFIKPFDESFFNNSIFKKYQIDPNFLIFTQDNQFFVMDNLTQASDIPNWLKSQMPNIQKKYNISSELKTNDTIVNECIYLLLSNKSIREVTDILGISRATFYNKMPKEKLNYIQSLVEKKFNEDLYLAALKIIGHSENWNWRTLSKKLGVSTFKLKQAFAFFQQPNNKKDAQT